MFVSHASMYTKHSKDAKEQHSTRTNDAPQSMTATSSSSSSSCLRTRFELDAKEDGADLIFFPLVTFVIVLLVLVVVLFLVVLFFSVD